MFDELKEVKYCVHEKVIGSNVFLFKQYMNTFFWS